MAFHIIPMCRPGRWFLGSRLGTVVWPGGWPGAWGDIRWAGPDGDRGWRVWGDTVWCDEGGRGDGGRGCTVLMAEPYSVLWTFCLNVSYFSLESLTWFRISLSIPILSSSFPCRGTTVLRPSGWIYRVWLPTWWTFSKPGLSSILHIFLLETGRRRVIP